MTLAEIFSRWLRSEYRPSEATSLVETLQAHGYAPESRLLAAYVSAGPQVVELPSGPPPWGRRRVHVGPRLPQAVPGELWLDTVELSAMVLLPGDPIEEYAADARHRWSPHRHWFALRSVSVWQYAGFLANAVPDGKGARTSQGELMFNASRLLSAGESCAVLTATPAEFSAYWAWFGKRMVDRYDWLDAINLFGPQDALACWTAGVREWAGGVPDFDVFAAIEPDQLEEDDRDAFDAEEAGDYRGPRSFFSMVESAAQGAAFRSTVDPTFGLRGGGAPRP